MTLWFVSAVHGRQAVTRLAMRQWAHLRGELAGRGVELRAVVVGDDSNLDTAREFRFDTIEAPNILGLKVNDGIKYAADNGADWICWTGSDDWLHADLVLAALERDGVVSGRSIAVVDLEQPRLRVLHVGSNVGAPPWFIDGASLRACGYRPVSDHRTHGLDGELAWTLRGSSWHFVDPHDLCRVDFKTCESMSSYRMLQHLARGDERDPFETLSWSYPPMLVRAAEQVSVGYRRPVAA